MAYFSKHDHALVAAANGELQYQPVYQQLVNLQDRLTQRIKNHGMQLALDPAAPHGINRHSISDHLGSQCLTLAYLRELGEAQTVERLMGRDRSDSPRSIQAYRHPVIEIRLTPDYLAVEMIMPPTAWYDQQNLVGKLSQSHYRHQLVDLLRRTAPDGRFGFWMGAHLDSLHVQTGTHLHQVDLLFRLLDTFAPRVDWWRLGYWYAPEDARLDSIKIMDTLFENLQALYPIYRFAAWRGDNNFYTLHHPSSASSA